LIVTFLVAPLMESELRRGLIINRGDWFDTLFHSNLAISLAIAALILTALCVKFNVMEKITDAGEREALEQAKMDQDK
jgi:TctA family transporter